MEALQKVLVTGGSGFVGRRLHRIKPDWIYISSKEYDLRDPSACRAMFADHHPDAVIHLAARTGGIKENAAHQAEFYYENLIVGTNVIHAAYMAGVRRLLVSLSTCAWPDVVERYPFTEEDLLKGAPAPTNFGYGEAKRALYAHARTYREQYGVDYSCFSPSNMYGPGNNFDLDASHFVSALISKVAAAKDGDTIAMWGTGKPLRQQLFVDDLVRIIPLLLEHHHTDVPLIVAPDENLSVMALCTALASQVDKRITFSFNNQLDGQYRKDGSNRRLKKLLGPVTFTSFLKGVKETYEWYVHEQAGRGSS